jgi:NADH dehydrogenase [ubiquinone] 1 alpha subcomplex assembly factor 7
MLARMSLRWLRPTTSAMSFSQSSSAAPPFMSEETDKSATLLKNMLARIRLMGPMTLAQYMQEALTHPTAGYYSQKYHVLGAAGDFVTSPEVTQMFGECLAVWLVHEWRKMGAPKPIQLVELGPGRGTLADDLLRTMKRLAPKDMEGASLHLVEVSQRMKQLQRARLCGYESESPSCSETVSKHGVPVMWHADLASVPRGFSLFVAHEFLDALPVHQFVRGAHNTQGTKNIIASDGDPAWHEILVDMDPEKPGKLRFVRSRERTPNAIHLSKDELRDVVEVCPHAGVVVRDLCGRIIREGGLVLIGDYGHNGEGGDTFRAFRGHRAHDPLEAPGTADLTADVDFAYIRRQCPEGVLAYGPVEQGAFLKDLGIEVRKERLLKAYQGRADMTEDLEAAYKTLTDEKEMGRRFKFMALFPATMEPIHAIQSPVGFHE